MTGNGGGLVNIELGKETDAAIGDALRKVLSKPAQELGSLVGDSIGIFGDAVRRKRQLNAQLGMEEVRRRLEADCVDLEVIVPPKEEELHLLMNGLSLSDDQSVRRMWAGLFAKALEPDSGINAERPFISVLETLSPVDAKIIDFLAFINRTEAELKLNVSSFRPDDILHPTEEELESGKQAAEQNHALQREAVAKIEEKALEYGLDQLDAEGWSDNLLRQGVIERTPVAPPPGSSLRVGSFDESGMKTIVQYLSRLAQSQHEAETRNRTPPKRLYSKPDAQAHITLEVRLSQFGSRLAQACGLT